MQGRTLIFIACYNERENIGLLIDQVASVVPGADILVVDDSSPDGTWEVLQEKKREHPQLICVQRPSKLGIGSAHKYALFYAMREGYKTVVTMDADFSHDPRDIPALLAAHGPKAFVTGSRYCEGGKSDYTGYRNFVSRIGNIAARWVLGVRLRELTTYFRVFDVDDLRRLPLRRISADGYSYGVQLIYYLRKLGVELREVPIHFVDRTRGASKIPRVQILWSALDLAKMGAKRLNPLRDLQPDHFTWDACANCGDRVLAMKHFGRASASQPDDSSSSVAAYRCTSVAGGRGYPAVYICLHCGLAQVPASAVPGQGRWRRGTKRSSITSTWRTPRLASAHSESPLTRSCAISSDPPGTLLEVGAYCGLFMLEARRREWDADGIEPSRWAANYARGSVEGQRVYGVSAREQANTADQATTPWPRGTCWSTYGTLRHSFANAGRCGPDGVLCLSTLDIDTWFPRAMG